MKIDPNTAANSIYVGIGVCVTVPAPHQLLSVFLNYQPSPHKSLSWICITPFSESTSRFISPASPILSPLFTCSINFQIHFAGLTNLVTFIHLFNQLPDSFHRPHQSCHLYSPVHSIVKLSFHHHHAQNQLLHHISFTACSKLSFSTNPFYCNRLMVPRTIFMEWIIRLDCFCIGGKWLLHQIQSLTPASKRTLSINPFHHHKLTGTHHICCCFALN